MFYNIYANKETSCMHKYFKIIFILFKYFILNIYIYIIKVNLFIYNTIYVYSISHALQHIKDIKYHKLYL